MTSCPQPFTVVRPVVTDDDNFVSSTIPEDDYAEYNAGTTYNLGDRVIVAAEHLIYESLSNGNVGNTPNSSPNDWVEVSATNRWKMFDSVGGTVSVGSSPMEFVVTGDRIQSFAFLDLYAYQVRIQAYEASEGTYYDETFTIEDQAAVIDWYQYFFSPINIQTQLIVFDIPPVSGSTYTITISSFGDSEDVSLGTFIMGEPIPFGFTQYNAKAGIISYSKKIEDDFGNVTLVKRANRKTMDVSIEMNNSVVDYNNRILNELDGELALWVGTNEIFESFTIYGFYRDFDITVAYPQTSYGRLQIEGLI